MKSQQTVLADLQADPRLGDCSVLLPTLLAEGKVAGQPYVVERMMPGLGARFRSVGFTAILCLGISW